jgi:hypothetical protein
METITRLGVVAILGLVAIVHQPALAQTAQRRQEIIRKQNEKIETYRRVQGVIREFQRQLEDVTPADEDPPMADDDDG